MRSSSEQPLANVLGAVGVVTVVAHVRLVATIINALAAADMFLEAGRPARRAEPVALQLRLCLHAEGATVLAELRWQLLLLLVVLTAARTVAIREREDRALAPATKALCAEIIRSVAAL